MSERTLAVSVSFEPMILTLFKTIYYPKFWITDLFFAKNLRQISPSGQAFLIFLIVVNILTFPLTAVLNALVMISVKMKSRLRDHKSNVLLALLALNDFSVGILAQPSFTIVLIILYLNQPSAYCVWRFLRPVMIFSVCASLLHMVLLSGERYLRYEASFRLHNPRHRRSFTDCFGSHMALIRLSGRSLSPLHNSHFTHKFNIHYFIDWLNSLLPCNSLQRNSQTWNTTGVAASYPRGKAAIWER